MKIIYLILLALMAACAGCDSEIDIFQEEEPTPVIYCLLDQDQPIQSLRLSRSYNSYSAHIPPDSPDSILFNRALEIALEQVNGDFVENRAFFHPVDVRKDSGFFPVTEHWIYQTDMEILPEKEYKLIVYLEDNDKIIFSSCKTVSPFEILNPIYPEARDLNFQTSHNPLFYWTNAVNSGIFQLGFILHYIELSGDNTEEKSLNLSFNTRFTNESESIISQSINSNQFYIKISEQVETDSLIFRRVTGIDSYIICGGIELGYLVRLQNEGQTFSLMEYTDVLNGIGVFSSRLTREIHGFRLADQTIDSIAYGRFTREKNFLDRNGTREEGGGL